MFRINLETNSLEGRSYLSYIYCLGCGNEISFDVINEYDVNYELTCSDCKTRYILRVRI